MKRLRRLGVLGAALAAGCAQPSDRQEPIRIGAVLSVTGPAAFLGDPELKTLELYVERLNQAGGIAGRRIELVHYDDGTDAAKANGFTRRLLESDDVDLIIGGTTTGATMAMVPLVERAGVPFLSLAGAVVVVEPVRKWVFKVTHSDRMAVEQIYEDMKRRGLVRVGLLAETSGFGQSAAREAEGVASRHGIEVVAKESYGLRDTDVTPQLTRLRNTPGVQALLVVGFGQGPVVVTKNYRQLRIGLPLYHTHGVASNEFIRLAGAAAEGARVPSPALLVADKLPSDDPQRPVVLDYLKAYRERYGEEPPTFGGYAHDALMIAVEALRKAGGTDRGKVRDAIEGTKGHVATHGVVNLSPEDHQGLDRASLRMLEIRGGGWSLLD